METENPFQAAQTIDPEVRAYIYSLVTAVGRSKTTNSRDYTNLLSLVELVATSMVNMFWETTL